MFRNKNFLLFVLVCGFTSAFLLVGWGIGALISGLNAAAGASIGAILGGIVGAEMGFRFGYVEAAWNRLLWFAPVVGISVLGGIGAAKNWLSIIIAGLAVIGAGVGVLIAKYMLRFFIQEPPTSILK